MAERNDDTSASNEAGGPSPPRSGGQGLARPLVTVAIVVAGIGGYIWYEESRGRGEADRVSEGGMPPGFEEDQSPEATAFRAVCSRCHGAHSPLELDEVRWKELFAGRHAELFYKDDELEPELTDPAMRYVLTHAGPAAPPPGP